MKYFKEQLIELECNYYHSTVFDLERKGLDIIKSSDLAKRKFEGLYRVFDIIDNNNITFLLIERPDYDGDLPYGIPITELSDYENYSIY